MKKKVFLIISIMLIFAYQIGYAAPVPDISAESAMVIEQNTGRVLYSKNADIRRPMASTTKIMTAIVALENGQMDDQVTVSKKAANIEGSSIWLEENERLSLEELLYGLMLSSGNDAAYAIGEHIGGGDIEYFIEMMNKKARELSAHNTNFTNPHGLDNENHYTTAHDLAKIAAYGMKNEDFRKIVSTKKKSISWSAHEWNRSLNNKNKMLWNYEGANGIKTGYTGKSGKCLVSSANRKGMQLVSVVLKSNDIWADSTNILDYAFDLYSPYCVVKEGEYLRSIPVLNGKKERIALYSKDEIIIPISKIEQDQINVEIDIPESLEAPIMNEQLVGDILISIGDELIASSKIVVKDKIDKRSPQSIFKNIWKNWMGNL